MAFRFSHSFIIQIYHYDFGIRHPFVFDREILYLAYMIDFSLLVQNDTIRLSCSGFELKEVIGHVGPVSEHEFEFNQITNLYEHFSNVSDNPVYITYTIEKSKVTAISKY